MIDSGLYLRVRQKEGRLFPDELAARLPDLPHSHPLAEEWRARADSAARLTRYLARRKQPLRILDLGCGNGWLARRLADLPSTRVFALDLFSVELKQAARLFSGPHLIFLAADIFHAPFPPASFDAVILASVVQYFPDLPALLRCLRSFLTPRGEIHLLDSPLYREEEIPAARLRTRDYYASLGFPEMAGYYFHHPVSRLDGFSPRWLRRPGGLRARLFRALGRVVSPFPWVILR